jgi:hypothetical protein
MNYICNQRQIEDDNLNNDVIKGTFAAKLLFMKTIGHDWGDKNRIPWRSGSVSFGRAAEEDAMNSSQTDFFAFMMEPTWPR